MGLFDSDLFKGGVMAGGGAFSGLMDPTGIPLVGGAFDNSDEMALEELRKNQGLYNIDLPELKNYRPEEHQYQGDYRPEEAMYQTVQTDPRMKAAEMSALSKLSGLADTGLSAVDEYGYHQARQLGARQAQQGSQAALANAQARGVAGSGLEFAMREMANQGGAQSAQNAALAQAADSARMRAAYQQAYGNALGQSQDRDYRLNAGNADIVNHFNELNTGNRNQAQVRNLDARQAINSTNVDNRNQAQLQNNNYRQQNFDNRMGRANGQASANSGMAQGYAAQNAARTSERNSNTQAATSLIAAGMGGGGGGQARTGNMAVNGRNRKIETIA
jgi:hypothetical protein